MIKKNALIGKNALIQLRGILEKNSEYAELIMREDIPVICVNKSAGKQRTMPFKALYDNNNRFWQQEGGWEFFIGEADNEKLNELAEAEKAAGWRAVDVPSSPEETVPENSAEPQPIEKPGIDKPGIEKPGIDKPYFGTEYEFIAALSPVKQVEHIRNSKKLLDSLIVEKPRNEKKIVAALVDTTRDAALVNHAALLNAMNLSDNEAKQQTQSLVDSTCELVKSSHQLISDNIFNDELMKSLVEKSNGTIIQHMTRVYLNGISFLTYYNKLVSTSSVINKLRISFNEKYRRFYQPLLPHIDMEHLVLERIFQGGMRAIPEKEFLDWSVGFLIHDIGKAAAVEYHEGEAAYNRDIVIDHVKIGYDSVMNKTNYPQEAGLITGYHHEYYGDSAGYGNFRTNLEQYKKKNPGARQDFCITFDLKPMLNYKALGYFPAKVLEIIDVYDSITDPNRKYRKPLSPEEAFEMMENEFVKKHPKIDIILFDIFAGFIRKKIAGK